MATTELPEIQPDRNLRQRIWRELILLARAYDRTRNVADRRRIAKAFDALVALLSIVAIAAPLIFTAIARACQ